MAQDQRPEIVGADGAGVFKAYGITFGDLTNVTSSNLQGHIVNGPAFDYAVLTFIGSAALTLSEFNSLPVGSEIRDFQAKKTHFKTAATTWVSSAASA